MANRDSQQPTSPAETDGGGSLREIALRLLRRGGEMETARRMRWITPVVLVLSLLFPIIAMLPEVIYPFPDLNDGAFHKGIMLSTISALKEGCNPLDFWIPTWLAGFPLFHYYQPGPYLVLAFFYFLFPGDIDTLVLYRAVNMLVVCLIPLAAYKAMKRMGLPASRAVWGAFLCQLIASDVYGLDYDSYTWWGWGLFAQAMATPFLFLALGAGYRVVNGRRRTFGAAFILFCAFITHILYGYIAAISIAIFPFMRLCIKDWPRRILSISKFYLQTLLLISFFIIPLVMNIDYHFKSYYDEAQKFDSLGANKVLELLFSGQLLDNKRLPVFSVLTAVGFYLCFTWWIQRKSDLHGWMACGFIIWILIYFGRTTWGPLMKLLPLSNGLHMERLSNGVHVFAVFLAAVALGELVHFVMSFEHRGLRIIGGVLVVLLVMPMLTERTHYMVRNAKTIIAERNKYCEAIKEFQPVLDILNHSEPQRIHVGHSGNWGEAYKVGFITMYHFLSGYGFQNIGNMPFSWSLITDFQAFFNSLKDSSYDLYDVHYLLTDQLQVQPPSAELVIHSGKHYLYYIPPRDGRFSIVAVPFAIAGDKESVWYLNMAWTQSRWAESRAHARLIFGGNNPDSMPVYRMLDALHYSLPNSGESLHVLQKPMLFETLPPVPTRGNLSNSYVTREEAGVKVTMEAPGYVLFKTTYHPNWHAYLDGQRTPTILLTPGLIGIEVPEGSHQLKLSYEPGNIKIVLLILGFAAALAMDLLRRRPVEARS